MESVQKVVKYGKSLAVVLPKEMSEEIGINLGGLVRVQIADGAIQISLVELVPKLSKQDKTIADNLYKKRKKVFEKLAKA